MRKYASLLLFALLLNGCDDGDLTVDTIDFDSVTPTSCTTDNTLIYKIKDQESLLLQLPKTNGIVNDPATYTYDIDNSVYRVLYRAYDGTVATTNICGTIPPSTPKVTEEWIANSGKINIVTSEIETENTTDGSSRITGYNHVINFTNITFLKPTGVLQTEDKFAFGTFTTSVTAANLTFKTTDTGNAYLCTANNNKQIYNYNSTFYIMIDNYADGMLANEATPAGQPRSYPITTDGTNKIYYRAISSGTGTLTDAYFCNTTIPSTPAIGEYWIGLPAYNNVTGTIEVTTSSSANIFTHTIVLKNVVVQKGNSHFKLGTSFVLGTITTVKS